MKVFICIIFSLFFLISVDPQELVPFSNSREDVSFQYPGNWFIKEMIYNNPYYIFISDIELKNETDKFKTGITITKFYHQSWQFNFDPDIDKALEGLKPVMRSSILENKDHKILSEEIVQINDLKYLKIVYAFNSNTENLRIMNYITVHNDSYLMVVLETTAEKINEYNDYFNNFMNKSVFFTADKNDNLLVDNPSIKIATDFMKLEPDNKEIEKYINLMSLAVKMNPHYAYLYFSRGIFYFKVCKGLKGKKQTELADITIEEFNKAAEYFIKFRKDLGEEKDINNFLTQSFFAIAEIYKNVFKDKDNAKKYYEKALEITESQQIRDSLNRL